MSQATPNPTPNSAPNPASTPATKAEVQRAAQDQAVSDFISQAGQLIAAAQSDTEIGPLLQARGYDAAKMQEGSDLQTAAQAAFTRRQTMMGAQKQAKSAFDSANLTARQNYSDFRETGHVVAKTAADRTTLGLSGNVPQDMQKFLTLARASYAAARTDAYKAAFATYGYPDAALVALLDGLKTLSDASTAQTAAQQNAVGATKSRDAAYKTLKAWIRDFKRIAKVALRPRPELAARLKV